MVHWKNIALAATAVLGYAQAAPTSQQQERRSTTTRHGYIVKLKENIGDYNQHLKWVRDIHKRNLAKRGDSGYNYKGVERQWDHAGRHFHGYAGEFDEQTLDDIRHNDEVEYVEEDEKWSLDDSYSVSPPHFWRGEQGDAPWGLVAISSGHSLSTNTNYVYDNRAGNGTYAYVIDTGIRTTHNDFEGRAKAVWTGYDDDFEDDDGHGTHVAATIAGKKFGVAKEAEVLSVKVFQNGEGYNSITMSGLEWAIEDIVAKGRVGKAVINMSLGGPASNATNDMVKEATDAGIPVIVTAGNSNSDAALRSPASAETAITVGAVNEDWRIWVGGDADSGSNWGKSVDIFAPGVRVESAYYEDDNSTDILTGTSMAAPHVAGIALYAMTVDNATSVEEVRDYITKSAVRNQIRGKLNGSPNLQAQLG